MNSRFYFFIKTLKILSKTDKAIQKYCVSMQFYCASDADV